MSLFGSKQQLIVQDIRVPNDCFISDKFNESCQNANVRARALRGHVEIPLIFTDCP